MKLFDEKVNDNNSFKKKINIDVEIDLSNSDKTTFRLKIGEDKLYI